MTPIRIAWFTFGVFCLLLGVLGVALPLLPTTPFVLLAAFAFARSSDRWHAWLLNHQVFGPMIENWRRYGAISRTAKWVSVLSMAGIILVSVLLGIHGLVLGIQTVVLIGAAAFVLTRPDPPVP